MSASKVSILLTWCRSIILSTHHSSIIKYTLPQNTTSTVTHNILLVFVVTMVIYSFLFVHILSIEHRMCVHSFARVQQKLGVVYSFLARSCVYGVCCSRRAVAESDGRERWQRAVAVASEATHDLFMQHLTHTSTSPQLLQL